MTFFKNSFFIKQYRKGLQTTVQAKQEKKVVTFFDLSEKERLQTNEHIDTINSEIGSSTPVSVDDWCLENKIPVQSMIKLLNKKNYPIVRLNKFRDAYPIHMKQVLKGEFKRQFRIKVESKAVTQHKRLNKKK